MSLTSYSNDPMLVLLEILTGVTYVIIHAWAKKRKKKSIKTQTVLSLQQKIKNSSSLDIQFVNSPKELSVYPMIVSKTQLRMTESVSHRVILNYGSLIISTLPKSFNTVVR